MRTPLLYAALLIATATTAHAQSTLDGQYQRMQQGQPAQPAYAPVGDMQPGSAIGSVGADAIPALPLEVQTSGNITYLNGGISDEEAAQLKAQANSYNLHVLLSAPRGEFISDVTLRVLDATGNAVLTVNDAGPYVYAKLPAGRYTIEASHGGAHKDVKLSVSGKGSVKEHIVFNEAD